MKRTMTNNLVAVVAATAITATTALTAATVATILEVMIHCQLFLWDRMDKDIITGKFIVEDDDGDEQPCSCCCSSCHCCCCGVDNRLPIINKHKNIEEG